MAVVFLICIVEFIVYSYIQKKNSREVTRGDNINMNDRAEDVVHGEDYYYDDPEDDYKVYTDDTHTTYYQFNNAKEKREHLRQKRQQETNA